MELKIKTISREEMLTTEEKEFKVINVDDEEFSGVIACMKIKKMAKPFIVHGAKREICIANSGYTWLGFAPRGKNWWLTVMFDENGELMESYFDITKENFVESENSKFIDLFLDVVITPNVEPVIIDQNELQEALDEELITQNEYDMAVNVANEIVLKYNNRKSEYYDYIYKKYNEFQN